MKTNINKENLKRAAEYIATIDPKKFGMAVYRSDGKATAECKSVGCVIGHCTILDAENVRDNHIVDSLFVSKSINWATWTLEFFGVKEYTAMWRYLFGSMWADCKWTNTPEHAVYRINKVLDGFIPKDASVELEIVKMHKLNNGKS
ncbi:hypothetical protein MA9V1_013 [Chryseobacterium phage MA9V-1]|nr:hypothetical protein MA9V1_013 [Chryseobacterium phage MA9V-1]